MGISALFLLFPDAIKILRMKLIQPILLIGELLKNSLNFSLLKFKKKDNDFSFFKFKKLESLVGLENLFHGQTERQSSQP